MQTHARELVARQHADLKGKCLGRLGLGGSVIALLHHVLKVCRGGIACNGGNALDFMEGNRFTNNLMSKLLRELAR